MRWDLGRNPCSRLTMCSRTGCFVGGHSVQAQGRLGLPFIVLPGLNSSIASAKSWLPSPPHCVPQPLRQGWCSRVVAPGRGQGWAVVRLILTLHLLFFRCLAAVPGLEGTRCSQVVSTLPKFWGVCTFFLRRSHLQSQLLQLCSRLSSEGLGLC